MEAILHTLQAKAGIHFMGQPNAALQLPHAAESMDIAQDAQPGLITSSNAGIPAFLSTYIDPKLIEILVAPMKAAEIVGEEVKKGDWTTKTAMFPVVESTGETSSYGDYSENGVAGVNSNYPERQSYHYQVMTQWGEMELETAGLGRIDWANRLNIASVLTLNKFQNKTYFFGVGGLQNYGLLNDPLLWAPISPPANAAGGTGWGVGSTAVALDVVNGVRALFAQLQFQANGLVSLDTKMTLTMSPTTEAEAMTLTVQYGLNVADFLKKNFPNLTIKNAPEYATTSGNLVQLIVDEMEGEHTASCGFTEKLRAHPIVVQSSSFKQKKSQGTWGTIIKRPFLIAQMLGV